MSEEKLYQILDIDRPEDFQYFDNIAALLEHDGELDFEILAKLIKAIDKEVLSELLDDYFEELMKMVPSNETDLFMLLDNIRNSLIGMARNIQDDTMETKLTEEIERFRIWYSCESSVECQNRDERSEEIMVLRDALILPVAEKLGGSRYECDFSSVTNYVLDEYMMSFGDMIALAENEDE